MNRTKIHVSWAVFLACALWMLFGGPRATLLDALVAGYVGWSLFWGLPVFWRWWRGTGRKLLSFLPNSLGCCVLQAVLSIGLLIFGGYFFSVFGGGIYQFARQWIATRTP